MTAHTIGEELSTAGIELRRAHSGQRVAVILMSAAIKKSITEIWTHPERTMTPAQRKIFRQLIARWIKGEPLAYLLGEWEFHGLKFFVNKDVLIPRPESELIIDEGITLAPHGVQLVDLGTGSGCLAITMAVKRRDLHIQAFDPSVEALRIARRNVARHNVGRRVALHNGTLTALAKHPLKKPWVLLANLPYLTTAEARADGLHNEPREALDGGTDGLDIFRPTLAVLSSLPLAPMLSLWEIDPRRTKQTVALIKGALPNKHYDVLHDLAGHDRVIRCF